jgi:hypothetical protein
MRPISGLLDRRRMSHLASPEPRPGTAQRRAVTRWWWLTAIGATPRLGTRGLDGLNPRPQDLSFSLGMFRDHDVVVSLTRMPAMLIDASLRLVERLVAAKPTARTAPNHVVRPRVLPSLSFHDVLCACLRPMEEPAAGLPNTTPMLPDVYFFIAAVRARVAAPRAVIFPSPEAAAESRGAGTSYPVISTG